MLGTIGIDNLSYTYQANTNKLLNVYDSSNNTSGFNDGNTVGDDYSYDANGNLKTDKNRYPLHEVFLKNKTFLKLADCCTNVSDFVPVPITHTVEREKPSFFYH